MTEKMTSQESTENKITRLEQENRELRETVEAAVRREELLIRKLKDYETAFYKELNTQLKVVRQSWTWRIGRLFVDPADWILNLLRLKKSKESDPVTRLNTGENRNPSKKNLAVIFDTFTQSCFSPEFNPVSFTPANWKKVLGINPVEGLFIESAWRGYGDTWKDKIANISGSNQSEVIKLVEWAKQQNLPTIFWNKEDPVHFEQFIGLAKQFDYIFTTDADCIADYHKNAPGATVKALPFAAQPLIHNPVSAGPRNGSVCFAGTYYDQRYHERKADMDFLLKPSLDYGLEIFDRHFGDTGNSVRDFRFPDIYQPVIKGKLDYEEMVNAYKRYKVFLNVNSVKYSPTMFARRVFELLASGTPVISTYSQGIINLLGEETVFISESEEDTRKHLDYLLGNELNWWKASLNGLRKVMENHTYAERTRYIFEVAGLEYKPAKPLRFSVAAKVCSLKEIEYLEKLLRQQSFVNFEIILVISGEEIDLETQMNDLKSRFAPLTVTLFSENGPGFENKIMATDSDYFAIMHPDHYYGPNYLKDYAIALKYASPAIMGKQSFFRVGEGEQLQWVNKGSEYQYGRKVSNATSIHRKKDLDASKIRAYLDPGEVVTESPVIFSIDPFNYLEANDQINRGFPGHKILNQINL